MQEIIKSIYLDKITGVSFSVSFGLWVLTTLITAISFFHLPPFVPVFNKMAWGYGRLGPTWELFIPLILVLVFLGVNSYVGVKLQQRIPLLSRFLFLTSLSICIFTSIFIVKILLIIL